MKRKISLIRLSGSLSLFILFLLFFSVKIFASTPVENEKTEPPSGIVAETASLSSVADEEENTETDKEIGEKDYTSSKLAEAAKQLQSLHFTETKKTVSTRVLNVEENVKEKAEPAAKAPEDKVEEDEPEEHSASKTLREGEWDLLVYCCIGLGVGLGLYTTYIVYQVKKENKNVHNH